METRVQKQFIDKGFGFPVVLKNVPMIKVRGHWTPYIDYNRLAKDVLRALSTHESRLTGDEVRFVRHSFEMTLQQFAARFDVSHPAVLKWERAGSDPTNMRWTTEKDLRMFIVDSLGANPRVLAETYRRLARPASNRTRRVSMDLAA